MIPLNDLPTIIDSIGTYKTRNGRYAQIREIRKSESNVTSFDATGTIFSISLKTGNPIKRSYMIWHISGRALVLKESQMDIVEKVYQYDDLKVLI